MIEDRAKVIEDRAKVIEDKRKVIEDKEDTKRRIMITQGEMMGDQDSRDQEINSNRKNSLQRPKISLNWVDYELLNKNKSIHGIIHSNI